MRYHITLVDNIHQPTTTEGEKTTYSFNRILLVLLIYLVFYLIFTKILI